MSSRSEEELNAVGLTEKEKDPKTGLVMLKVLWEDGKETWELRKDLISDGMKAHVAAFDRKARSGGGGWFAENHEQIITDYKAKHAKKTPSAKRSSSASKSGKGARAKGSSRAATPKKSATKAGRSSSTTKKQKKSPRRSSSNNNRRSSRSNKTEPPAAEIEADDDELRESVSRAVAEAAASVARDAAMGLDEVDAEDDDGERFVPEPVAATPAPGHLIGAREDVRDEVVGTGARAASGVATAFGAAARVRFHGAGRLLSPAVTLGLVVACSVGILFVGSDTKLSDWLPFLPPLVGDYAVQNLVAWAVAALSFYHVIFSNAAGETRDEEQVRSTLLLFLAAAALSAEPQAAQDDTFWNVWRLVHLVVAASSLRAAIAGASKRANSPLVWAAVFAVLAALAVVSHTKRGIWEEVLSFLSGGSSSSSSSSSSSGSSSDSDSVSEGISSAGSTEEAAVNAAVAMVSAVVGLAWKVACVAWTAVATVWQAVSTPSSLTMGLHSAAALAAGARALESRRWQDALSAIGTIAASHQCWVTTNVVSAAFGRAATLCAGVCSVPAKPAQQALTKGLTFALLAAGCDDDNAGEEATGKISEVAGYD